MQRAGVSLLAAASASLLRSAAPGAAAADAAAAATGTLCCWARLSSRLLGTTSTSGSTTSSSSSTPAGTAAALWQQQRRFASAAADGQPVASSTAAGSGAASALLQEQQHASADAAASSQPEQQEQQEQEQQPQQRPVQLTHMVLQAVCTTNDAGQPLNSIQLFEHVQAAYGAPFASRRHFKQSLHLLQKNKWVVARPAGTPAAGAEAQEGAEQQAVGSVTVARRRKGRNRVEKREHFTYLITKAGRRVDVFERGSQLQEAARTAADAWIAKWRPEYTEQLAAGRLELTPDNMGLLEPQTADRLLARQAAAREQRWQQRGSRPGSKRRSLF